MSSINIKDRQVKNVTVLDIDGDLRIGGGGTALRTVIRRLIENGHKQILLNLEQVSYIDSSGLGELIASHITLSENGGEIRLLHLTRRVRELMTITKLVTVFDVYEDETTAIDSFEERALTPGDERTSPSDASYQEAHS
jgi:anti-sigma B factor antagonist